MNNSKRARERQTEIRQILQEREVVSVNEFCAHFGASIATIRNDLAYLEGKGYLQLSLIHISEPTRQEAIAYAVVCL